MRVCAIQRATCFSPNSVEKDHAILSSVVTKFAGEIIPEQLLSDQSIWPRLYEADVIFTMGRYPSTLRLLQQVEQSGVRVLNPSKGICSCDRLRLQQIMQQAHVPYPSADGEGAFWLKRSDMAAQGTSDVVFCESRKMLEQAIQDFKERGIAHWQVQKHVEGDLIKFYGVCGTGFFRYYYPSDDGISKFGDEARNGVAHHYKFSEQQLQQYAHQVSEAAHVPIYGGDAIVEKDGQIVIIDFNDWPSYSRCREEAACAIASLVQ